ncbi:hypothetical protein, partial [Paenibacillus alba]|uniref:hypothetical protein n=1 Tax=Paenibacillus alba TaxID=1197127 RepID=UPI001C201EC0
MPNNMYRRMLHHTDNVRGSRIFEIPAIVQAFLIRLGENSEKPAIIRLLRKYLNFTNSPRYYEYRAIKPISSKARCFYAFYEYPKS